MIRSNFFTATLALLSLACAPAALAEDPSAAKPSPPAEQAAPAYSDAELHSFAVARLEMARITATYVPKLVQNLREQAQVKQAASEEMVHALKQQGMSVDKYKEMQKSVEAHPELVGKVNQYMKEAAHEKGLDQKSPDEKNPGQSGQPKEPADAEAPEKAEMI